MRWNAVVVRAGVGAALVLIAFLSAATSVAQTLLEEDFSEAVLNTDRWTAHGDGVDASGEELAVTTSYWWADGIESKQTFSRPGPGEVLVVEGSFMREVGSPRCASVVWLQDHWGSGNYNCYYFEFAHNQDFVGDNQILCRTQIGSQHVDYGRLPDFVPGEPLQWRFRVYQEGCEFEVEFSDGQIWIHTSPHGDFPVGINIHGGSGGGCSCWDDIRVRIEPIPVETFCDDFSGTGVDADRWMVHGDGVDASGEELAVTTSYWWADGIESRQTFSRPGPGEVLVVEGSFTREVGSPRCASVVWLQDHWGFDDYNCYYFEFAHNQDFVGDNQLLCRTQIGSQHVDYGRLSDFVPGEPLQWRFRVFQQGCEFQVDYADGHSESHWSAYGDFPMGINIHGGGGGGYSYWDDVCVYSEEIDAVVAGTVTVDGSPLGGVVVDLYDSESGILVDSGVTDPGDGSYMLIAEPGDYVLEMITPLGYRPADGCSESRSVALVAGSTTEEHFALVNIPILAEARSKGYWKHQYKVYDSGRGHAHEFESDLASYQESLFEHFYSRPDDHAIQLLGTTYSDGPSALTFHDALSTLSASGASGSTGKALSQFLALLLNVVSLKVGTHHEATEDGMVVSQVISHVADLLCDDDPTNEELAKELAELVNNNELIASGVIPSGTPRVPYAAPNSVMACSVWPNPFAGSARISYAVPHDSADVKLSIYDVSGRRVRTLVEGPASGGVHQVLWCGEDDRGYEVAKGVYFYRLTVETATATGKIVLLR
jgi:hypothetical protein